MPNYPMGLGRGFGLPSGLPSTRAMTLRGSGSGNLLPAPITPPKGPVIDSRGPMPVARTGRGGSVGPTRRPKMIDVNEVKRSVVPRSNTSGLDPFYKKALLAAGIGFAAGTAYYLTPEDEAMDVSPSGELPPSKDPSSNKTAKKTNQVKPKATAKPTATPKPAVKKPAATPKPKPAQQSASAPVTVPKSAVSLRSSTLRTPGFNIDTSDYQDTFMVGPSPNPNPTPKPPASKNKGKGKGGSGIGTFIKGNDGPTFIMPEKTDPNHIGDFVMPPTDLVKSKVGNYHDLSEYYKRAKKSGKGEDFVSFGARALTRGVANTLQFLGDKIGY